MSPRGERVILATSPAFVTTKMSPPLTTGGPAAGLPRSKSSRSLASVVRTIAANWPSVLHQTMPPRNGRGGKSTSPSLLISIGSRGSPGRVPVAGFSGGAAGLPAPAGSSTGTGLASGSSGNRWMPLASSGA